MMFADLLDRLQGGDWVPERAANEYDGGAPFYRVYTTSDERHIAVGAIEPQFYAALLQTLNLDALDVAAQHDRSRWPEVEALISERFRSGSQAEWIDLFEGVEACVTPVLNWKEAVTDHHLANDRGTYIRGAERWIPRPAPRFHLP